MSEEIMILHNVEHRVGKFGYVFKRVCGEWTRSNHTEAEVLEAIRVDERQKSNYKGSRGKPRKLKAV